MTSYAKGGGAPVLLLVEVAFSLRSGMVKTKKKDQTVSMACSLRHHLVSTMEVCSVCSVRTSTCSSVAMAAMAATACLGI